MSFSLEITGKDIAQISAARGLIPAGSQIKIAFLGNETHEQRIEAARIIRDCGFEPEPIISSRRLVSVVDADALIGGLRDVAAPQRFMIVGGDPSKPAGPYRDSLELLGSDILERHAVTRIGIAGYPEGHPKISDEKLWAALEWKQEFLGKRGVDFEITTQFGFDPEIIIEWIADLRARGFENLVRIGVPGPTDAGKLLRFGRQFGVRSGAAVLRRYGISLGKLLHPVGPERFMNRLEAAMEDKDLGRIDFHLYSFGGINEGVGWLRASADGGSLIAQSMFTGAEQGVTTG